MPAHVGGEFAEDGVVVLEEGAGAAGEFPVVDVFRAEGVFVGGVGLFFEVGGEFFADDGAAGVGVGGDGCGLRGAAEMLGVAFDGVGGGFGLGGTLGGFADEDGGASFVFADVCCYAGAFADEAFTDYGAADGTVFDIHDFLRPFLVKPMGGTSVNTL